MDTTSNEIRSTDPNPEYEKHLKIFEQSPIAIELYDKKGMLVDVNHSCLSLFGVKNAEEIKGFNLFADPNLSQQTINDMLAGKSIKYELVFDFDLVKEKKLYRTSRAGTCHLDCYINPINGEDKEPIGYIVHVIEITDRKKTEAELKKSEDKFRRIVESSTTGMYFFSLENDKQLIFTGSNPAADRIIGFSHHELIGKTIEKAFPNLKDTEIPHKFRRIAKGEIEPYEFEIKYKDDRIDSYFNVHVFRTDVNTITVQFIDISEHKKAELLLEKQAKELQDLNVNKDKFFSIVAHDLKNPFNAIIGFSELMLKNFSSLDDQTLHKGLTTIESAASHAFKLLENLLIWSRNQTGRNTYDPVVLNLKARISEVIKMAENSAGIKDIRLSSSIRKNYYVFADKEMLDTILKNLISNAIKYSYRGGKVKVSAATNKNNVEILVSDNGVGIPHDKLNAIFQIDKRTNTLGTADEQGTGLGLILCKDFLTKQGGHISVESTIGKGSKFTISLPLYEKND